MVESVEVHRLNLVFCLSDGIPTRYWPRAKDQHKRGIPYDDQDTLRPFTDALTDAVTVVGTVTAYGITDMSTRYTD